MWFLETVLLASHLVCFNISAAVPLLCIWLAWSGSAREDGDRSRAGRQLAGDAVAALLLGGLLGGGLVGLHWQVDRTRLFEVAGQLSSRVVFGAWEFLFSLVLMTIYFLWWPSLARGRWWHRVCHALLAVLAATNLLYHFPPLFTILSQLRTTGFVPQRVVDSAAFRSLLVSPEVVVPTIHYWLASLATACVYVQCRCVGLVRSRAMTREKEQQIVVTARVALAVTLLQIPGGVWLLMVLHPSQQALLLGGNLWSGATFVTALVAVFALLHQLAAIAGGEVRRAAILKAAGLMLVVIGLMTLTLVSIRAET
jgi:hypothetical protein